jgi:hypothetical protein
MTTLYSENYYKTNWDRFIKPVTHAWYVNLENELSHEMSIFKDLPKEAIDKLELMYAKKIIDKYTQEFKKQMALVKNLNEGKVSLGNIYACNEREQKYDLITRFEFNCYQLKVFTENHIKEDIK